MTGHKRLFILILIGVLYFSGVAMVLYPMIGNIYSLYHSRADINEYQQTVNNLTDEEIQDAMADNPSGQGDELTPLILIRPLS